MEERNQILREKLGTLYNCSVAAAVCLVLALIPFINIAAVIIALVAAIMAFFAMLKLKDIHDDYHTAFMLSIMNVALKLISGMVGDGFAMIVEVVSAAVTFAQTYFMIRGTNSLLMETQRDEIVARGEKTVRLYFASLVMSIATIVVEFPWNRNSVWIAVAVAVVSVIVSVWAMVAYIKYLGAAKDCF
jgi:hypothetical protein